MLNIENKIKTSTIKLLLSTLHILLENLSYNPIIRLCDRHQHVIIQDLDLIQFHLKYGHYGDRYNGDLLMTKCGPPPPRSVHYFLLENEN